MKQNENRTRLVGPRSGAIAALALMVMASLVAISSPVPAATYTVTDLGGLGGDNEGVAWRINNEGQIVGQALGSDGWSRPFLWDSGVMVDLGTLGGSTGWAFDINDSGAVVGESEDSDGNVRATLWESGRVVDLGTLGGAHSFARAITNEGAIVGESQTANGNFHGFLLQGGTMTDLGTLGGLNSRAYGINENGVIVGEAETGNGQVHAFQWNGGVMNDLGTLNGENSSAMAINLQGQVVGSTSKGIYGEDTHAFLWDSGTMTYLDTGSSGLTGSFAYDINDNGQIVGAVAGLDLFKAVVWQSGVMSVVESTGVACGINNLGQIVGMAFVPNRGTAPVMWQVEQEPPEPPSMDIAVDSGGLFFAGETSEFFILVTANGVATEASSLDLNLTDPGGVYAKLSAEMISPGLYKATYTMPLDAKTGVYVLAVHATVVAGGSRADCTRIKCIQVSATMADWEATLKTIHPVLVDIQGKMAVIDTDLGQIRADLKWLNATISAIWKNKIKVSTTIGDIVVDSTKVDSGYISDSTDSNQGLDPAMYVGIAALVISVMALVYSHRGPPGQKPSALPDVQVSYSSVRRKRQRRLRIE